MNYGSAVRRLFPFLPLMAIVAAGLVPSVRTYALRSAGRALVVDGQPEHADVIVISVDADGAGVLEASDLARRGFSSRVAVFADPPDDVDLEFRRRGVPYFDAASVSIQQLRALGVESTEQIGRVVTGTNDEGNALPRWSKARGFRTIIFVCTRDHSRRLRRAIRREMAGIEAKVIVHASAYSQFDPEGWWLTREGTRIEIIEMEKLIADIIRHPFS